MEDFNTNWEGFLDGVKRGFSMVPFKPGTKEGYEPWKAYQLRKPTPYVIEAWQNKYPDANPALVCGQVSGIIALDLDGPDACKLVKERFGPLPITVVVESPGGPSRMHLYYKYPEELSPVHNFAGGYENDLAGVDLRADGGVVMYPGSIHPNGGRYQFVPQFHPDVTPIADAPEWLLTMIKEYQEKKEREVAEFVAHATNERIRVKKGVESGNINLSKYERRKKGYAQGVFRNQIGKVDSAAKGTRNTSLFVAAATLSPWVRDGYLDSNEVVRDLEAAAYRIGLDRDLGGVAQIRRTINSGFLKGQTDILHMPEEENTLNTGLKAQYTMDESTGEILEGTATKRKETAIEHAGSGTTSNTDTI